MPLLVMTTAALRPFWATFWATCDTARFGRVAPGGSADRAAWPPLGRWRGLPGVL
jgi:hypothetical protein